MSTNWYHHLAQGEMNPHLHVGKFYSAGRHCCMCNSFIGAAPKCPNCQNDNEEEMVGRVNFIWAMRPSLFTLYCMYGACWINEYGEEITALDLIKKIQESHKQEFNSIGTEFS